MWTGVTSSIDLMAADRWTVAFFALPPASTQSFYPMQKIRSLVRESKSAVNPSPSDELVNYLGLENIRSNSGELVGFNRRPSHEIKSRSKTFVDGDVLFGRLRPELNKVYLAIATVSPGICSNEFIVLKPLTSKILPRYLRYALASPYVSRFAAKLRTGASLPRMSADDLLDISIPVPPMAVQQSLVTQLDRLDRKIVDLRKQMEGLPNAVLNAFERSLETGTDSLSSLSDVPE
jgi:hypothetical protein